MNKKTLSLVGMIFSLIVALCGILVMLGAFGGNASYPSGAASYYDNGYASFGADFYSFVNNNAAEAASAASTAAGNIVDITDLLKNVFGIFLMGFGMMGFCFFGIINSEAKKEIKIAEAAVAPVAEPVVEEVATEETVEETIEETIEETVVEESVETEEVTEEEDTEKILAKLQELKEEGILSEEEFAAEKEKFLK